MMYSIGFFIGFIILLVDKYLDKPFDKYIDKPYITNDGEFSNGLAIGFAITASIGFFLYGLSGLVPSAQDVVDGKTTYKVTYINNVPTDSILIYKDEYKHINWW